MNILILNSIHKEIWGGGEKWMITTAAGLKNKGHDVTLAGRVGSRFLQKSSEVGLKILPLNLGSDFSIPVILKLAEFFKKNKTDIVLVAFNKDVKLAGLASKLATHPAIVPMHGLPILTDKWIDRLIYRLFIDGIIVNASSFKSQYISYGWVDPESVQVINNGLETDIPLIEDKERIRNKFDLPESFPTVGIFGRLSAQKQHHYFLDVAKNILVKMPQAIFLIVGDGEDRKKIEAYTRQLAIDDHVYFLGMQTEVFRLYSYCDLVLLTSSNEGIPNAVIESMLMATPVVAFDVGGVAEAIPFRDVGVVVPPDDIALMSREALELLNDNKGRTKMGKAAREFVRKKFPMQKMIDETDNYIRSFLV
jgi:glycosyltransferase involved in cell wall biosynthesis